jgi:predicted glycogen debranching enzyme
VNFSFKKNDVSLEEALALEWIETNGLGGYSSSTILNCHTRKYHGLLVSKLENLPGKYVLLSNIEDIATIDANEFWLNVTQYPNHLHRTGYDYLQKFSLTTHPVFTYQLDDVSLVKEILMLQQENTILVKYRLANGNKKINLKLRPFTAYRNFHKLAKQNNFIQTKTEDCKNGKSIVAYQGMPKLFMQTDSKADFDSNAHWYHDFEYQLEQERGFDYHEDLFTYGTFTTQLASSEIIFSFSLQEQPANLTEKWQIEIKRRQNLQKKSKGTPLQAQLKIAVESFFQKKPLDQSLKIIAGYHWFNCWGRDAMIALPGLTLYSGQENSCLAVLRNFAAQEKQGLIPNFLGTTPEQNAYNTVDASLWFGWTIQQYYLKTNNLSAIEQYLWPTLKNIFSNYKNGTLYNIKMLENGLLYAGNKDTNVTWMDAQVNGSPVTPRHGMQVEVNALWFNLLCFLLELATLIGDPITQELKPLIKLVKKSFVETFWDEGIGYLKDYVLPNNQQQDFAIRPNQIFAVSMPFSPLTKKIALQVMRTVKSHLLTPYGLRTLSPQDPRYIGIYSGDSVHRDSAYHNGTVWPWLLGHFTEGLLKLATKHQVAKIITPCATALTEHLKTTGIGTISEIFDGDAPHKPNGCISQAWSVAELLRLSYLLGDPEEQ